MKGFNFSITHKKALFILLLLVSFYKVPFSQAIPDYQPKQDVFTTFDSVLHIEDSLEYKIKKWGLVKLDHVFFAQDSAKFHSNHLKLMKTNFNDYCDFSFSLKFYASQDLFLNFTPSHLDGILLKNLNGYLHRMSQEHFYSEYLNDEFNHKKINESLFFTNPQTVKYILESVPAPHRTILNRRQLRKKTAAEGIKVLLNHRVKKPDKLKKVVRQKSPWTIGGTESVQLSQAYLNNWTKGGENSIAIQSDLQISANYKEKKVEWENYIRHKFGVINSESFSTQINTDNIEMNSKYGIKASKKWYYSALFDFKTQFFAGYSNKTKENQISGFMAPAYLTFAIGMDYKKDKTFTLLLSPWTSKLTYIKDTAKVSPDRYKIPDGKKVAFNNGASLVNNLNWEISTELNLKSKLDAFIGYFNNENSTQIDWELIFDMRINQFLSTRINTQLRYFDNESSKVQFKEYFSINFNYKF